MDTVKVFGMLFMLQISANLMSLLFYVSGTSDLILQATLGLDMPGWAIILFIWLIMFILGAPLEPPAILMICTPIFLPILIALGYDPVLFGIVMVLSCEVATLSPPIGMSIFAIMRVAPPEAKMWDVYVGITPYMLIITLMIILITFAPQIVMLLPNTMIGK
jgi:TRAP-type C4-dicarboxylate transport system permease large subunit